MLLSNCIGIDAIGVSGSLLTGDFCSFSSVMRKVEVSWFGC